MDTMLQKALKVAKFIYFVLVLLHSFGAPNANFLPEIEFSTQAYSTDPDVIYIRRQTDIPDCIRECEEAASCKFINYRMRSNVCILSLFTTVTRLMRVHKQKKLGMGCWLKPSNHVEDVYYGSNLNVCDSASSATLCEAKYCGIPVQIGPFMRSGNMYTVGSKQAYGCWNHSTHKPYKEEFYCDYDGKWTIAPPPCSYSRVIDLVNEKMIFYFSEDRVIQSTAARRCMMDKGRLVQITTHEKLDIMSANFVGDQFLGLWLDAHRKGFLNWRTSDNKKISKGLMIKFSGRDECATTGERWHLDRTDCYSKQRYVCEIKV